MMHWVFVLALFGLVAIPLVPSIRVWRLRIDSRPLRIRTQYGFETPAAGNAVLRVIGEGLVAGRDATLTGSVRTTQSLFLDVDSTFERLEGQPVLFGPSSSRVYVSREPSPVGSPADLSIQASIVAGDLVIPADETVEGSLIVRGSLTVGERARIRGAVKVHGDVIVGPLALVDGPLFSTGSISLDTGSAVFGPMVADEVIRLAPGTTVGTPQIPSTVAGRVVEAQVGARVFGIVHSMEQGRVVK